MNFLEKPDIKTVRPQPFEFYTSAMLWNDPHISREMLKFHLDPHSAPASRVHEFIHKSVDWLSSRFNISQSTHICDFGCGPGLYTTRFAEKGARVTGIDLSQYSLKYAKDTAKEKRLAIDYVHQDYLDFATHKRFDLVSMIYLDFSVLSPAQRNRLLTTFHNIISMDGCIIVDVESTVRFDETEASSSYDFYKEGGFWSPEPHHEFMTIFKYSQEKVILRKFTVIEENRIREIYVWCQCYSLETLRTEFQKKGLEIIECYSDVAGSSFNELSPEFAVIAKKMNSV